MEESSIASYAFRLLEEQALILMLSQSESIY